MSLVSKTIVYTAVYSFINNALSINVYENEGPQDIDEPIAVYFGIGDVPQYDMNKESLDADFQVSFYGKKSLGAQALRTYADTLITALDRKPINIAGYNNEIVLIREAGRLVVEDDYLHLIIEFNLKAFA